MFRGFIAALFWFTFDDMLAKVTGVPILGQLPFWPVVGGSIFLATVFGFGYFRVSNKK